MTFNNSSSSSFSNFFSFLLNAKLSFIFKLLGGVRTEGPASVRLYSVRKVGVVGGGSGGVWGVVPGRVWWWVVWWGAVWGEVLGWGSARADG